MSNKSKTLAEYAPLLVVALFCFVSDPCCSRTWHINTHRGEENGTVVGRGNGLPNMVVCKKRGTPRPIQMSNTLLPRALHTAISTFPLREAMNDDKQSGSEEPADKRGTNMDIHETLPRALPRAASSLATLVLPDDKEGAIGSYNANIESRYF